MTSRRFLQHTTLLYKTHSKSLNCWSCSRQLTRDEAAKPFCPCEKKKILPVFTSINYFNMFQIKKDYKVDKTQLTRNFRALMRQLHPDLFAQGTEQEKKYSAEQASLVNKAYRTLSNPISRGLYMLQLEGIDFERESVETADEVDREKQMLLMSVLEMNEQLDEIKDKSSVKKLEDELSEVLAPLESQLDSALVGKDFKRAVKVIAKLKYFKNIEDRLEDLKLKFDLNDQS